jgi:osmoprotectant transport system substrate-binding protein
MDRKKILHRVIGCCLLLGILGAWSVGCTRDRPIIVASKNFTEQVILGEIIAQHLEHRAASKVERKLNLGGTMLAHRALVNGEIDLYPEYTGTALTSILKLPPFSDPQTVFDRVRAEYRTRFRIEWLPLGFNNTFAMVIRGEEARRGQIHLVSEAAKRTSGWRLGVGYEFQQRADGLEGLIKTYALPLKGPPQTMDLGLLYKALEQKKVDMVAGNATDGALFALDVVALEDDKRYFPPYQAAVAVREDAFAAHPALRSALLELSGKFSDTVMRKLNYQVDGQHRSVGEVAEEFLRASGLVP